MVPFTLDSHIDKLKIIPMDIYQFIIIIQMSAWYSLLINTYYVSRAFHICLDLCVKYLIVASCCSFFFFFLFIEVIANVLGKLVLPLFPESFRIERSSVFGFIFFGKLLPSVFSCLESCVRPPWLVNVSPKTIRIASSFSPILLGLFNV